MRILLLALAAAAAFAACDGNQDDAPPGPKPDAGGLVEPDAGGAPVDELTPEQEAIVRQRCSTAAWKSLYAEYFGLGPGRPGSCTFDTGCHGAPEAAGTRASGGYQCSDELTCCRTLVKLGYVRTDSPRSGLYAVLRRKEPVDGGGVEEEGFMPLRPDDFFFPAAYLERVEAWIATGEDVGGGSADAASD